MAKVQGIAGKTLILKSLKTMFFGSQRDFESYSKGMEGERKVGRMLRQLPEGWRVWHDLSIGKENIDHLVVGAKGVFIIEAKNYSGTVLATPKGLYSHGSKEASKITTQVWRQVYTLREQLGGQYIFPVLVFLGEIKGDKAKGIPCLRLEQLIPYLRDRQNILSYSQARELFTHLDTITR